MQYSLSDIINETKKIWEQTESHSQRGEDSLVTTLCAVVNRVASGKVSDREFRKAMRIRIVREMVFWLWDNRELVDGVWVNKIPAVG